MHTQPTVESVSKEVKNLNDRVEALSRSQRSANLQETAAQVQKIKDTVSQQGLVADRLGHQAEQLELRHTQLAQNLNIFEETSQHKIAQANDEFAEAMEAAKRAFAESNAQKRPVELWASKQAEHDTKAIGYHRSFYGSLGFIGVATVALIIFIAKSPATINHLLAPIGCDLATGTNCSGFSMKGLVVTAAVLTFFTILLWFARLQMKLYLAERHLALDARERRAFSETYVGLLAEGDTSREAAEQRSLVYAALFRPSADGTVREEGGIDPAISAVLSKLLTK